MRRHKITAISPDSIGESLALEAGDFLLEIDGRPIGDVFDYRMACAAESLEVLIEKGPASQDVGELWALEIEKDFDEELGLTFTNALMDAPRTCRNRCIFCFIDQQPPGLRDSLYIKDDDPRLSFLHGNYVTLTNASPAEIDRIARYHLSPMRISVHTMDMPLRRKMLGNNKAGALPTALKRFKDAGIEMHFQAVLCKNRNDGAYLDETIKALLAYRPNAASLAIVPAGLTRHRTGLPALSPFTAEDARAVITQIKRHQEKCLRTHGTAFVFPADEWYILAEQALPEAATYEDFPQLENGVGMLALFRSEFFKRIKDKKRGSVAPYSDNSASGIALTPPAFLEKSGAKNFIRGGVVTGVAAFGFMVDLMRAFEAKWEGVSLQVYYVVNTLLGEGVTVSGLLMGADVIAQMQGRCGGLDVVFMPENAFRVGTEVMLDGVSREDLEAALGVRVVVGSADGGEFCGQLLGLVGL